MIQSYTFDKIDILLRDFNLILLDNGIKHHLRSIFVFPLDIRSPQPRQPDNQSVQSQSRFKWEFRHLALGINWVSKTCEKGPCPRSWQRPARVTHRISLSEIPRFGWFLARCSTIARARCATPEEPIKTNLSCRFVRLRRQSHPSNVRIYCVMRLAIRNRTSRVV